MRRKGVPCACDPCKGKNSIRAINNVSPDPNGDFNIKSGTGIAISNGPDNEITIINSANPNAFVEGDNIDLIPSGDDIEIALTQDPVINGTLTVNGDIIQNGAAYETHAEKVYSKDDYIIMREGAVAALPSGDFSGFQVRLYDGVNDGRLVIDNQGTARVGDVGDEEPLLTRDESADLTDGALFKWDAANFKAVNESTVGDDTHPLKSVNGVLTPVDNSLALDSSAVHISGAETITGIKKFTQPLGCQTGTVYNRLTAFNVSSNYSGYDLISGNPNNTNTYGGIRVVFNQDTNGVSIELIKVVNGNYTSQVIASM